MHQLQKRCNTHVIVLELLHTRVCPCRVYAGHENAVQCQKHALNKADSRRVLASQQDATRTWHLSIWRLFWKVIQVPSQNPQSFSPMLTFTRKEESPELLPRTITVSIRHPKYLFAACN